MLDMLGVEHKLGKKAVMSAPMVVSAKRVSADDLPVAEETVNSFELDTLGHDLKDLVKFMHYIFFGSLVADGMTEVLADVLIFQSFHDAVQKRYADAPYHNYQHAVDICHAVFYLLCNTRSTWCISDVEIYSLLISAFCHDV